MNLVSYAIICGISVHAIAEAKRPASFLKKLILIYLKIIYCLINLFCRNQTVLLVWQAKPHEIAEITLFI